MISNKKKSIISLIISALLIIFCVFAILLLKNMENDISEKITQTYQTDSYVIGVYQDKIAIFTQGDTVPIEVFDVYVSTLPEADQKELKNGVLVKGKSELRQVIEDYTS